MSMKILTTVASTATTEATAMTDVPTTNPLAVIASNTVEEYKGFKWPNGIIIYNNKEVVFKGFEEDQPVKRAIAMLKKVKGVSHVRKDDEEDVSASEGELWQFKFSGKEWRILFDRENGTGILINIDNKVFWTMTASASVIIASVHSMRDVADEEQNTNDIVGILLQGTDLSIPTLITYNRRTNTYHENYNSVIVPEMTVVTGIWESLTTQGQVKLRNLRDFYELKMPDRLRKLAKSLREGKAPVGPDHPGFTFLDGGPGVIENIPNSGGIDPDTMLHYDLDNIHVSSVQVIKGRKSTKADIETGTGDTFVSSHSYVEAALTQCGFNFLLTEKSRDHRKYTVSFRGLPLTYLNAGETQDVAIVTEAIELAVSVLAWNTDADTFPLVNGVKDLTWLAAGPGIGMRVSAVESTIEFYRLD